MQRLSLIFLHVQCCCHAQLHVCLGLQATQILAPEGGLTSPPLACMLYPTLGILLSQFHYVFPFKQIALYSA